MRTQIYRGNATPLSVIEMRWNVFQPIIKWSRVVSNHLIVVASSKMTKGLSSSVPLLNGSTTTSSYQPGKESTYVLSLLIRLCQISIDKVASRLRAFLHDLGYAPTISEDTDYELETYMRDLMHTRGLQCSQLEDTLHLSASVVKVNGFELMTVPVLICNSSIQLCSPSISLEAKKNAALYAWFDLLYLALHFFELMSEKVHVLCRRHGFKGSHAFQRIWPTCSLKSTTARSCPYRLQRGSR